MSLAELAAAARKSRPPAGPAAAALRSRAVWEGVFGAVNKEDPRPARPQVAPGGYWTRSTVSGANALKRLLEAMRSNAPGGWSDDRWQETRNLVSIAFVAITAKGRILSQSEFQLFRKDRRHPDGKIPVGEGDRAYELVELLERPNPQDTFGMLLWRYIQQQDLTGTALTWMVPNRIGTPMELYCVPTAMAVPMPQSQPDLPDGGYRIQPVYPYGPFSSYPTPMSAVGALVPGQWMLRFSYPHPFLRYEGYSPLTGLRLEMDELNMINRSRHASMRKAINPSAVVDLSEMEDGQPWLDEQIDRMRAEFENLFYGPENAGGIIVPPPGGKVEPWGANPVDMDYPQGWDQLTNFIMSGFGMTKPAAGMVEDSSYSTLFATLKQIDLQTLQPWRDYIAAMLTRHLARFWGDDLILEIRGKRIDDHDVKDRKLQMLCQNKAITKGELRKELDMPMFGDERDNEMAGEDKQAQQGMGGMPDVGGAAGNPVEGAGKGPEPQEPGEKERPRPGSLGEGALGPRDGAMPAEPAEAAEPARPVVGKRLGKSLRRRLKSLQFGAKPSANGVHTKSFYDQVREACRGEP